MKSAIRNPQPSGARQTAEGSPQGEAGWPSQSAILDGLPGADRIRQGLEDVRAGRRTIAACLVRMARPRLSRANLMPPAPAEDDVAELELYRMFASEGSNAHSRYNALVRELISFEHALDHRMSRQLALPGS